MLALSMQSRSRRMVAVLALFLPAVLLVLAAGCRQADESKPDRSDDDGGASDMSAETVDMGGEGFNVVFVSVDTTRADHIECYGHPTSKTPNIDRMAKEGTRFESCISSAPLTMPSHSTMMTGSYPFVHGVRDNGIFVLNDDNRTLAEIFHDAGYATHAEIAAPVLNAKYGLDQGFDTYNGIDLKDEAFTLLPFGKNENEDHEHSDGLEASDKPSINPEVPDIETDRKGNEIADCAIAKMQEFAAGDKPFFMFLHFFDPHWPFEAPEPFKSQFRDEYLAEIAYFDSQFGRVLDAIRNLKTDRKTFVILTSDHGEGRGEHNERTHSTFLYDTTLHVPLLMWCPGEVPADQVVDAQVRLVDLAPTVLDMCKLGDQKTPQMQGTSLLPLLADPKRDPGLLCYSDTMVPYTSYDFSWLRSLRERNWKYIHAPKPELYRVAEDRSELFNIVDANTDRAETMRQQLYDVIDEAPSPPGARGALMEMTDQERRQFEALGYVSDAMDADSALMKGKEIDNFEPVGANPKDKTEVIACMALGMGCFRVGEFEQSIAIWKRYITLEPDDWTGWNHLGRAYMAVENYDEARVVLEKCLELRPDASDERRMLGNLHAYDHEYDEAERLYREAIEINPADAIAHLNLGKVLRGDRKYDEAFLHFQKAVESQADFGDAMIECGMTLRLMGRTDEAIKYLSDGLALDPNDSRGHTQLAGIYLLDLEDPQRAVDYLLSILDGMDDKSRILQSLSDCYVTMENYEQALQVIEQLIELKPDEANPYRMKGQVLVAMGRVDDGIAAYRKSVEISDNFYMAWMQLADALESAERLSEAREAFQTLVAKEPSLPAAYTRAAQLEMRFGDIDRALADYRAGLKAMPRNVNIPNDLAWILATHPEPAYRDAQLAVETAEAAAKLTGGTNAAVLDTLAAAYAEAGRFDEAVAIAAKAIAIAKATDDEGLAERISGRADLYRNKQPYRDTSLAQAAPPAG